MKQIDVLVVGAGVAGASAALALSRSGMSVLLVDRARLPRHKVCGCCLNSDAVAMLSELGLLSRLRQSGAQPIERVTAACNGRSISLPSRGGLSVSRYVLDALLLDAAAESGCEVKDATTARINAVPTQGERVGVCCTDEGGAMQFAAGVVLVADGLAGSCMADVVDSKRMTDSDSLRGYGAHLPAGRHGLSAGEVVMRCGAGGYVGTVALEDGALDIACAMKPAWVKACRGPAQAASKLSEQAGHSLDGLDDLKWQATAPLTGRRERQWAPRIFFLGDAAGYVEPFTGEGMAWAMRSALAAAPFAIHASHAWNDRIGDAWERSYQKEVRARQRRCILFAKLLRRPAIVSACIATANRLPKPLKKTTAKFAMPAMFRSAWRTPSTELPAS